jgi:hypothetical protein
MSKLKNITTCKAYFQGNHKKRSTRKTSRLKIYVIILKLLLIIQCIKGKIKKEIEMFLATKENVQHHTV